MGGGGAWEGIIESVRAWLAVGDLVILVMLEEVEGREGEKVKGKK